MHAYRLFTWLALLALGFFAGHTEGAVGFPPSTASINLPGSPTLMKANATRRRAIVMLSQADQNEPQVGLVLDLDSAGAPTVRGRFSVEGNVEQVAVSPDGSSALLQVSSSSGRAGANSNSYAIITLSLNDPARPVEAGRQSVPVKSALFGARSIALAADASAYAFIPDRDLYPNNLEMVVLHKMSPPATELSIDSGSFVFSLQFSEDHRYLALGFNAMDVAAGGIIDWESSPPSVQTQQYSGPTSRYQCLVGVLKGGYVLAADARAPQLDIYAPSKGMPRLAMLPSDGGDTCPLMAQEENSVFVATPTTLLRADVHDMQHPQVVEQWLAPVGLRPLALLGALFYEAGPDNALHAFRLNGPAATEFDWIGLAAAHDKIMAEYQSSTSFGRDGDAFEALQQAGVAQAIQLPIKGIGLKKAAAILDDYGFFASGGNHDKEAAEAALRRAMELDPDRTSAYFNFMNLLLSRFAFDVDFEHRENAKIEIKRLYQTFLEKGGNPTLEMQQGVAEIAQLDETGPVCQSIADYANKGYLGWILADSVMGVKVRGHRLNIFSTTEGSAHVPSLNAFEADTDGAAPIEFNAPWLENLWGGDYLGIVIYHGVPYVIHYRDATHPEHLNSLIDDTSCEFGTTPTESVSPKALEPELCSDLIVGQGPDSIEFVETDSIPQEKIRQRYGPTHADKQALVDFRNNGHPVNLVHLALESGAGAGCDEEFFDVWSESNNDFAGGQDHELLAELQHLTKNPYPLLPCENSARLFKYHGKIYFENQPAGLAEDVRNEYHYVTRIEKDQVREVCGITFADKTEVLKHAAPSNDNEQSTKAAGSAAAPTNDDERPTEDAESAAAPVTKPPEFGVEFRFNAQPIGPLDAAGVSVDTVASGSVAELAGIQPGDVIIKYNDVKFRSIGDLKDLVRRTAPGDTVTITLWHQNIEKTVEAHF